MQTQQRRQDKILRLITQTEDGQAVSVACRLRPCREVITEAELVSMCGVFKELHVEESWHFVPSAEAQALDPMPPPTQALVVAHALAGSAGPDIRLFPDTEDASAMQNFELLHSKLAANEMCLLVAYQLRDLDLVLVPVFVQEGAQQRTRAFWAYTVPASIMTHMAQAIHLTRFNVVLDLDETLLLASTTETLADRMGAVSQAIHAKRLELQAAKQRQQDTAELLQELSLLGEEKDLIQQDMELLQAFKHDPLACAHYRVADKDHCVSPTWCPVTEPSYTGPPGQLRPVVRLDSNNQRLILSRISPQDPSSSVVIRVRPEWDGQHGLLPYMNGSQDAHNKQKHKRWEVFVCTTASRAYAEAAWCLLDPHATLFPHSELSWRLVDVPRGQKKDLLNVLRVRANSWAQPPIPLTTDAVREERPPLSTVLPLCVLVDDRADVYDSVSNQALLQVLPFDAYKEAAALRLPKGSAPADAHARAADSSRELVRVKSTLVHLRSNAYQYIKGIEKHAKTLSVDGQPESYQQTADMILSWVKPVPSVTMSLAGCQHAPPPSLLQLDPQQLQQLQLKHVYSEPFPNQVQLLEQGQEQGHEQQVAGSQPGPPPQQQQQQQPPSSMHPVQHDPASTQPLSQKRPYGYDAAAAGAIAGADADTPFAAAAAGAGVLPGQDSGPLPLAAIKQEPVEHAPKKQRSDLHSPTSQPQQLGPMQLSATIAAAGSGGGAPAAAAGTAGRQQAGRRDPRLASAAGAAGGAGASKGHASPQQQQQGALLRQLASAPVGQQQALSPLPQQQQSVSLPQQQQQQQQPAIKLPPAPTGPGRWGKTNVNIPGLQPAQPAQPAQQQQQQQQPAVNIPGLQREHPPPQQAQQEQQQGQQVDAQQPPPPPPPPPPAAAAAGVSSPPAAAAAAAAASGRGGFGSSSSSLTSSPAAAASGRGGAGPSDEAKAAFRAAIAAPHDAAVQERYRQCMPAALHALCAPQDLIRIMRLLKVTPPGRPVEGSKEDQQLADKLVGLMKTDAAVGAFFPGSSHQQQPPLPAAAAADVGAAEVQRRVAVAVQQTAAATGADNGPVAAAALAAVQAQVAESVQALLRDGGAGAAAVAPAATSMLRQLRGGDVGPLIAGAAAAAAGGAAGGAAAAAAAGGGGQHMVAGGAGPPEQPAPPPPPPPPAAASGASAGTAVQDSQQQQPPEAGGDQQQQPQQDEAACPGTPPAPPPPLPSPRAQDQEEAQQQQQPAEQPPQIGGGSAGAAGGAGGVARPVWRAAAANKTAARAAGAAAGSAESPRGQQRRQQAGVQSDGQQREPPQQETAEQQLEALRQAAQQLDYSWQQPGDAPVADTTARQQSAAAGAQAGPPQQQQPVAAAAAAQQLGGAQRELELRFDKRVKFEFVRLSQDGDDRSSVIVMRALLLQSAALDSPVMASADASDKDPEVAVELAARQLADKLKVAWH